MPIPVLMVVLAGGAVAGAKSGAVFGGVLGAISAGVVDEHDEGRLIAALKGGTRGVCNGALTGSAFGVAGAAFGLARSAYLVRNFQRINATTSPSGFVYAIAEKGVPESVKIGRTNDLARRLFELKRVTGKALEFVSITPTGDAVALEKATHKAFAGLRTIGEWFKLRPGQALSIPARAGAAATQGMSNTVSAARETMPLILHAIRNSGEKCENNMDDNHIIIIPVD